MDLTKADGITTIPNGTFDGLAQLEKLALTGCSLSELEKDIFKGLENLKEVNYFPSPNCEYKNSNLFDILKLNAIDTLLVSLFLLPA